MIEVADNIIQFTVLLACWLYVLWKLARTKRRVWTPMALCYSCLLLAVGYWLLYLSLMGHTPLYSYASDFGWYAAALFLSLMLQSGSTRSPGEKRSLLPWLAPVISVGAFFFFIQRQDYVSNAIAAVVMGYLGWTALSTLRHPGRWRTFAIGCLLYYCLEYALWFSSWYWAGDSLGNSYFWFDLLQTANYVVLLVGYRKAVAD